MVLEVRNGFVGVGNGFVEASNGFVKIENEFVHARLLRCACLKLHLHVSV